MLDKKTLRTLYAILMLCLVLRIGISVYLMDADAPQEALPGVSIAKCLADGKGFAIDVQFRQTELSIDSWHSMVDRSRTTAYAAPVYPAFLGFVYATVGEEVFGVPSHSIVQSLVDTLTCFLIFLFSFRILNRPKAALVSSAMYAVYLPASVAVADPLPATLAALFALLACYLLMKALGGEVRQYVHAGAMIGLLMLLKPVMLAFPLVVGLMLMLRRRRMPGWAVKATAYAVIAYLVVSPWIYRSYRVFHTFIPVSAQLGNTLWTGTGPADGRCPVSLDERVVARSKKKTPDASGLVVSPKTYRKIADLQYRLWHMSEVQMDRALVSEAAKEVREHKGRYALLVLKRFFRLWFDLWTDVRATAGTYLLALWNVAILVLAICAYRQTKVDYRVKLVTVYLCAYVTIITMFTSGGVRDSYPAMPMVIILAAAYLGRIFDGGSPRSRLVIRVQ